MLDEFVVFVVDAKVDRSFALSPVSIVKNAEVARKTRTV
jgi:hypothetical protein